ncbi:hypothetical protein ABIC07_009042 [Bradyrhizobium sp. RT9a]
MRCELTTLDAQRDKRTIGIRSRAQNSSALQCWRRISQLRSVNLENTDVHSRYLFVMVSQSGRSIGILNLERGAPAGASPPPTRPGSLLNPSTFNFPIIAETVTGACVENVVRGDPGLEPAYVAAARRLVERGAVAISSTCGFSIRHQQAVAASVDVPVAMSSLLRYCCKSRFSPMTKILRAAAATFAYNMRGTSRPHAKFIGDFGNAIEVIRISDRSLLSVFAKNLEPCNFRLLQQNPPFADVAPSSPPGRQNRCINVRFDALWRRVARRR